MRGVETPATNETTKPVSEPIWSLKPLYQPPLPQVKTANWSKTPVDRFILAKLETNGMKPSPPADKKTLLRRVTFDLTGLPPTSEEMDLFVKDKSPKAFERVVDRLLASPRYGERWARHWLDIVHYADSHGHSQDRIRTNAWPYRDYVIGSFNQDKPYARFVQEQLAGDVLFPEDPNGIVALGFIAAGPWDDSSQVFITEDSFDKRQAQNLDRDDMVSTTISTFVSTTVHCARCHNHKFDPIPQKEYYGLQAVFAGIDRVDRPYDLDSKTNATRQSLLRRKTALDVSLKGKTLLEPSIQDEVAKWEKEINFNRIEWVVLKPTSLNAESGAAFTNQPDGSVFVSGNHPDTDSYAVEARTDLQGITGIRLEVLADESLPMKGPGRAENGNLALSELKVTIAAPASTPWETKPVPLQNPTADYNEKFNGVDYDITKALDGDPKTSWGIYPETGKSHFAFFECTEEVGFAGGSVLTFILEQKHKQHQIGRFRLSVTAAKRPVRVPPFPESIAKVLGTKPAARTDDQRIELAAYYLKTRVDQQLSVLPEPKMVYAVANDFEPRKIFKPAKNPRPIHLLKRGDINKPEEEVAPGALSLVPGLNADFALPDTNDEGSRRSALAKWITDPGNVLTWRSIVNRIWHYHFGRGIVDSPSDFGVMGSRPTHPELLDWLALQFQESGGSFKHLDRMIVLSAVYQQSSAQNEEFAKRDSDNRFLWRMNRTRLDAEEVRDAILQVSGKLDLRMGGPADMQFKLDDPNPPVTPVLDYTGFDADSPTNFRRSIYRFIFRTIPDPFMDTLDCPDASQLTPTRVESATALQALAMWNNHFVLSQSRHLAQRVERQSNDPDKQIEALFRLVLERAPSHNELREMKSFVKENGMANACRVLFNSNEFMFVN